jgi:hypothetical protein
VRVVALSYEIEAAEESSADTAAETVIDTFLTIFDVNAAGKAHGSPHLGMFNGEFME